MTAAELLRWIRPRPHRGPAAAVAIDGPGGAGKSVLAAALGAVDPEVAVVHMDDFFLPSAARRPGAQSIGGDFDLDRVHREVLAPHSKGWPARYRRYDWDLNELAEEHVVEPGMLLILEGVYSMARCFDGVLDCRLWVECPRALRLERGVARDGEDARERWLGEWMPAEDRYRAAERPDERANARIDGSPLPGAGARTGRAMAMAAARCRGLRMSTEWPWRRGAVTAGRGLPRVGRRSPGEAPP